MAFGHDARPLWPFMAAPLRWRIQCVRSTIRAILSLSQCGLFERKMVHPNTCGFSSAISWWSELPIATRNQGQAILSYMNVIGFGAWHVFGPCAGRILLLWLSPERRRKRFGSLFGARIRADCIPITPKTFKGSHGWSSELPASALAGKVKDSRQAALAHKVGDRHAIAQEWGTAGNPACWKGLLDKVMPRRQKLQRGITLRSLIRMKDIEGRSMAAFLYWAAAEPRTLHLARIGGTAPTLIPPPRFALDVVKQLGIGGEIAEEAG